MKGVYSEKEEWVHTEPPFFIENKRDSLMEVEKENAIETEVPALKEKEFHLELKECSLS